MNDKTISICMSWQLLLCFFLWSFWVNCCIHNFSIIAWHTFRFAFSVFFSSLMNEKKRGLDNQKRRIHFFLLRFKSNDRHQLIQAFLFWREKKKFINYGNIEKISSGKFIECETKGMVKWLKLIVLYAELLPKYWSNSL